MSIANHTETTTLDPISNHFRLVDAACYGSLRRDFLDGLSIAVNVIGLVIVLLIGTMATLRFMRMSKMNKSLKILFYVSVLASILTLLSIGIVFMVCFGDNSDEEVSLSGLLPFFSLIGYLTLFMCVLGTLLVRLHITFEQSMYRMSKQTKNIFITLYCIIILLTLTAIAIWAYLFFQRNLGKIITWLTVVWILFLSICFLYITTAIAAVWIFCSNLLKLATLESPTSDPSDFNATQMRLVNMSTKYITLFCISAVCIFACLMVHIVYHYAKLPYHLDILSTSVDCVISIVCLYMQYAFASKY